MKLLGGKPPNPVGRFRGLRAGEASATQNYVFCFIL